MSKTDTTVAQRPVPGTAAAYINPLPVSHPKRQALDIYARTAPAHLVFTAGTIIEAMPDLGRDVGKSTEEMNKGYSIPRALNDGNIVGKELARPFVEGARILVGEASGFVAQAHHEIDAASDVWKETVQVDGRQLSREGALEELDHAQAAAARAEARGDHAHLHRPVPTPWAVAGAIAITGIEFGAVYTPLFNPANLLSLLPLVAFTAAVFIATHVVTMLTGRAIRGVRETLNRRADLFDGGWAHLHSEAATGSGSIDQSDAARSTGLGLLGKVGSAHGVDGARTARAIWLTVCVGLTMLLVSVVVIRLDTMVIEAGRGLLFGAFFAGFIGLVVIGIVVALVWGYSRGNLLGRRLQHLTLVTNETAQFVEDRAASARENLDEASACLMQAASTLAEGEESHARHLAETLEGVQVAATVLGVRALDPVAAERMIQLEPFARRDVDEVFTRVMTDRASEAARIPQITRRTPAVAHPHASHHADRPGAVDLSELEPARLGATVVDPAPRQLRRVLLIVGIALAILALAAAGALVATGAYAAQPSSPSASASMAAGANPASLINGVDYSYLATTDGLPDRWSCTSPIEIGVTAGAPSGASAAVKSAIDRIAGVSGLPLRYGDSTSPQIAVSYVPTATVQRIGHDNETVGVTQTRADSAGTYQHADIAIARDSDVNAIGSTTARLVLLHELMHAVGLGHATATNELMAPVLDPQKASDLGQGDIAALQSLGCR